MFEKLKNIFKGNTSVSAETVTSPVQSPAEEYNNRRDTSLRKSFCYAPSVNMLFAQDGSVQACCHNADFILGKYPQQSISEIWNSSQAKEMRAYMEEFNLSKGCGICDADLQTRNYGEIRAQHFDHVPKHERFPTMMEFLLSNTCNLECVMCQGKFSSLIRKNREKLPPIPSPYDNAFVEQLKEFIPHLHETRFSGSGEAFSIEMYYRIWDMIIEMNPGCIIMVQTNGTYLNARIKDYLERGNFQIGVSLDSLKKDVYENIRIHSDFERVMSSIEYFHEYSIRRKVKFNISTCVMPANWMEMPEFVRFANGMDAVATFHKVWGPPEHALCELPAEKLQEIYDYLSAFDFPCDTHLQKQNRDHYWYFVSVIKSWIGQAGTRDKEVGYVSTLADDALLSYATNKFVNYFAETIPEENERKEALQFCLNKIETLTAGFNEKLKREFLRKICVHPVDKTYKQFSKADNENLTRRLNEFAKANQ